MTATPTLEAPLTAEEYEALPDNSWYELVDGRLVERNMSLFSGETAASIIAVVGKFSRERSLGRVFASEVGIRIHPDDPLHTRRPDAGFISYRRAPERDTGYLRLAPELVVEVVSPGDVSREVRAKVDEWLSHGVLVVWVAFPEAREIHANAAGEHPRIFTVGDEITAGDVLPGFAAPVAELFPERLTAPTTGRREA